jgi:pyrimidine deaminase RibD-like protein
MIARGYTHPLDAPHAEAVALAHISGVLVDVIAVVTLEPHAFDGRTPSCAQALVKRRMQAVVVALLDPHPKNRGRGLQMLEDAGIAVILGVLAAEAAQELGSYLMRSGSAPSPQGDRYGIRTRNG